MKNFRLILLCGAVAIFGSCSSFKASISQTQARMQSVQTSAYAEPLAVEVIVDTLKGRVVDTWPFTNEQVEIDLGNDIVNVRNRAIYLSSKKHNADIIVAPIFKIETTQDGKGYEVELIGFPAHFKHWRTATEKDLEWIQMEKGGNLTWEQAPVIARPVK